MLIPFISTFFCLFVSCSIKTLNLIRGFKGIQKELIENNTRACWIFFFFQTALDKANTNNPENPSHVALHD